jgi:hypothetical protein
MEAHSALHHQRCRKPNCEKDWLYRNRLKEARLGILSLPIRAMSGENEEEALRGQLLLNKRGGSVTRWKQYVPLKCCDLPIRLYGIVTHESTI